jgi:alpha/beta superfamily hydrolase
MGEAAFFDAGESRLFGVLDRGTPPHRQVAVVFCHPYGEERQLTDRVFVRFARHLGAAGFATFRFDCRGHGDSDGEFGDHALSGHVADTEAALAVVRDRLSPREIVLLGLRLGASVAALVAARAPAPLSAVLWSPIVQGTPHVRELLRKKLAAQLANEEQGTTREALTAAVRQDGFIEFEGGRFTAAMLDELSALDLTREAPGRPAAILLSHLRQRTAKAGPIEALAEAYRTAGSLCDLLPAEEREYWDVRSMFDGVFPEELYRTSLAWFEARWPRSAS